MGQGNKNRKGELNYQVYLGERKLLISADLEYARIFDKAILTLTAGAFGLSLAFIKQIAYPIKGGNKLILILSWIGFALSLLFTLVSFLTSQSACKKQIKILENQYLNNCGITSIKNKYAQWTLILNILSIIFFIAGVIALAVFVAINLK